MNIPHDQSAEHTGRIENRLMALGLTLPARVRQHSSMFRSSYTAMSLMSAANFPAWEEEW